MHISLHLCGTVITGSTVQACDARALTGGNIFWVIKKQDYNTDAAII